MEKTSSNKALVLIHNFTDQIYKGLLDKKAFREIINSDLKLKLKDIVSMIFIDTKMGDWNTAQRDAHYLIYDIQHRILNGYCIVGKKI